jgi:hypothetical protein
VVLVDEQSLEERLVELAAEFVGGAAVGGFAVLGQGQCLGEIGLGRVGVVVHRGEARFGCGDLGGDAGLFGLEEVERDRIGVVGVEQSLAFILE